MRQVDTINVWFSPIIKQWCVCALVKITVPHTPRAHETVGDVAGQTQHFLKREKNKFDTFDQAVGFIRENYTS